MHKSIFDHKTAKLEILKAKQLLENPSLAAKITGLIGQPLEKGFKLLPKNWHPKIITVSEFALNKALKAALLTMRKNRQNSSSEILHKVAVAGSGALGGVFGMAALTVELPISTTIMLRSIADIARSEGEDISATESHLACLQVFAFGGKSSADDASETGYFLTRYALAQSMAGAVSYLASAGAASSIGKVESPLLIKLITTIAERFSIQVSQKAAAQAIPAIGAVGGAVINTLFIDHFQDIARGHFIIRKYEKIYGEEVQELYNRL